MAIPNVDINWAAVIVGGIAAWIVGMLWYSVFFGNIWMKLNGIDRKKIGKMNMSKMLPSFIVSMILTILMAYVLAHFAVYTTVMTWADALKLGFGLWLGFMVPILAGSVMWDGKPFGLFVLNAAHYLVALEVAALIITLW